MPSLTGNVATRSHGKDGRLDTLRWPHNVRTPVLRTQDSPYFNFVDTALTWNVVAPLWKLYKPINVPSQRAPQQ
jgi:hypothetical protein